MCIATKLTNISLYSKAERNGEKTYLLCTHDNEASCYDPLHTYLEKLSLTDTKYHQYPSNKIRKW